MNDNFKINFSLKGVTSILIGAYIFIAGFLIEKFVIVFSSDVTTNLSLEQLEVIIISIAVFVFILSTFTLYYIGKRNAKKRKQLLWNDKSKAVLKKYLFVFLILFISLFILINLNFSTYITPTFLIFYGLLLLLFKNKERKNLLVLSGLCVLLAVLCFLIPTYWASSFSILGIAHVAYGFSTKE